MVIYLELYNSFTSTKIASSLRGLDQIVGLKYATSHLYAANSRPKVASLTSYDTTIDLLHIF